MKTILLFIWCSPTILIGLLWSLICRPKAIRWNNSVIEMDVAWLPGDIVAQTWGRLILFRTVDPSSVRNHELVHVTQNAYLGPLFLLAYGIASLIAIIEGKNYYWDNYFEVQARKISGQD